MKAVKPWPMNTECPEPEFAAFKTALNAASYHNAGEFSEWRNAKTHIIAAAAIASNAEWPYWAMERMFKEIAPLVAWESFMQTYINTLQAWIKMYESAH